MPTYKNETGRTLTFGANMRFAPNETIQTDYILPYAQIGLSLIDANIPEFKDHILHAASYTIAADTEVSGEAVGTGDAETFVFELDHSAIRPGTYVVYADASELTEDTDYTFDYINGEITFVVAPAEGVVITADYDYMDLKTITLDYVDKYHMSVTSSSGTICVAFKPAGNVVDVAANSTYEESIKWMYAPIIYLDSVAGGTAYVVVRRE